MNWRRTTALAIAAAVSAGGPALLLGQTTAPASSPATAPASSETRRIVEAAAAQVLGVLRDGQLPTDQKSQRASAIVEDNIDFPTFARLASGPAWNDMTDVQRDQFLSEFHKLVRSIFIEGIDQYDGQDAVVTDERQEPRGDRVVRMRIIDTRGGQRRDVTGVDFRLRQFDGRWKAIDLSIAGISLAVACRAQFAGFLRDGGVSRVIQVLKEKNAKREREEGSGHGK
ncbi:MAG: ABC transporter substrate-binding protein [Planctomycetota bacterium]|nr:ABC transporter substrate-binding protein [Planctomycetota bacterium]